MSKSKFVVFCLTIVVLAGTALPVFAQLNGAGSISAGDLKRHLSFLASDEMKGRNTPSPELKIAAKYLASRAESYGFKPLMPDGSFFQRIDLLRVSPSAENTKMIVTTSSGTRSFAFPADFSATPGSNGSFSGDVVFVGFGLSSPDNDWDDFKDVDVSGKIVVMLDARLPGDHPLNERRFRRVVSSRSRGASALGKGAAAVLTIANSQTEARNKARGDGFPVQSTNPLRKCPV